MREILQVLVERMQTPGEHRKEVNEKLNDSTRASKIATSVSHHGPDGHGNLSGTVLAVHRGMLRIIALALAVALALTGEAAQRPVARALQEDRT